MADGHVPVFRAIKLAYSDVYRVFAAMPRLVGIVFVILLAFSAVQNAVPKSTLDFSPLGFMLTAANAFLLTPYLIAVHRFILIDEVTYGYALAPQEPRFLRFFLWSVVLSAIPIGITLARSFLQIISLSTGLAFGGMAVVVCAGIFIGTRLIILFPAIAVEAPGASAANAFSDTKGYFWNIFFIIFLAALPLILLAIPLVFLTRPLESGAGPTVVSEALSVIVLSIISSVTCPLYVAIASRLFQALAERLMGRASA
jgi:hypothetical protein